ncbi:hypothetical protein AURDEDRAFT_131701 [Auricularia subglabra TFB-10046 SS5]|uniref:Uncharacterized protein n=1 Tax=Auricularia subglabra (strain TFB-10046 / SS5) TaxID=717982 RepID=J0LAF2_AURST|nr:hypothetical protein AURDEDRAFT_131701 [Auricularia subglabra TFB-10046 SS5]
MGFDEICPRARADQSSATWTDTGAMEDIGIPDLSECSNGDEFTVEDLYMFLSTCCTAHEDATAPGTIRTVRDAYLEEGPTFARIIAATTAGTGSAHTAAVVPALMQKVLNHGTATTRRVASDPQPPQDWSHNGGAALSYSPVSTAGSGKTRYIAPGPPSALSRSQHDGAASGSLPCSMTSTVVTHQVAHDPPRALAPQDGGTARPVGPHPPFALPPFKDDGFSSRVAPSSTGVRHRVAPGRRLALALSQGSGAFLCARPGR